MNIKLQKSSIQNPKLALSEAERSTIQITGSKSESNRLLILQALHQGISIDNLSNADDTKLLQKALQTSTSISDSISTIDIHHAGTAMRFLTAYFSAKKDAKVILTGSSRMKERPIKILVDALRHLGADIEYLENEGFPPLRIKGKVLIQSKVTLNANVSSQYISALLLMASSLKEGLELTLQGTITSVPYIKMTLQLLNQIGVETHFKDNVITVKPNTSNLTSQTLTVESDWSSASYWYSIVALSPINTKITLATYKKESLQGDSVLAEIYKHFGVETIFRAASITLRKFALSATEGSSIVNQKSLIDFDLSNAPDIAQTIAVTVFGLGLECHLTGLHTLKIKETDRLVALQNELSKLGASVTITDASLYLKPHKLFSEDKSSSPSSAERSRSMERLGETFIDTYNDHRMAMAFAPLALVTDLGINNANVVSKSYPDFWDDLRSVGFKMIEM